MLLGRVGPGAARVRRVLRGRNLHPAPGRAFDLDPGFLAAVLRRFGTRLLGFWHSHPGADARPSRADGAGAWAGTWTVVVGLGEERPEIRAQLRGPDGRCEEARLLDEGTSRSRSPAS